MNQKHITAVLISTLIAFVVSQWGGLVQWFDSPKKKAIFFGVTWTILILTGIHYGPYYALAALISGLLFLAFLFIHTMRKLWNITQDDE